MTKLSFDSLKKKRCKYCRFCDDRGYFGKLGAPEAICRIEPPVLNVHRGSFVWPEVDRNEDYCGQFEPDPDIAQPQP